MISIKRKRTAWQIWNKVDKSGTKVMIGEDGVRIFCFGDSNTYGYDARSRLGERLPAGERWPEILAEQYGWEIQNEGMNGRKIPGEAWSLAGFDRALLNWGETDLHIICCHICLFFSKRDV